METATHEIESSASIESPILDLFKDRRSHRAFSTRLIEPEKITALFEAARWAPSSMNEQPWTYLYATREQNDLCEKIVDSLNDGNRIWAAHVPLLIVSMSRKTLLRNGVANASAKYDLGAANAFLTIQATSMKLNVRQMGGFHPEKLRANLNIPESYDLGPVLAIGYAGEVDSLPDNLKARELSPRTRYLQSAFVKNKPF